MQVTIKKWGNSPSVRLPAAIFKAANLKLDMQVDIREEEGRIILTPVRKQRYNLDELIAGITPENLHPEVDFGPPVGKEIF